LSEVKICSGPCDGGQNMLCLRVFSEIKTSSNTCNDTCDTSELHIIHLKQYGIIAHLPNHNEMYNVYLCSL